MCEKHGCSSAGDGRNLYSELITLLTYVRGISTKYILRENMELGLERKRHFSPKLVSIL